ncbi:hypothetical protein pb186bvf_011688 [Paramecium bursaria]
MNNFVNKVILLRHGERADDAEEIEKNKIVIKFDPHLTELGHLQSKQSGNELQKYFKINNINKITIITSPYLRCLQTVNELLSCFDENLYDKVFICRGFGECLMGTWFDKNITNEVHYYKGSYIPEYPVEDIDFNVPMEYPEEEQSFFSRFQANYLEMKKQFSGVVLIITHSYGIHAINMLEKSLDEKQVKFCSISIVNYQEQEKGVYEVRNYVDHLI